MADYKQFDPKGWCGDPRRGAALGRHTRNDPEPHTYRKEFTLNYVPLDHQGYDPLGTYFGDGDPLYWVASQDSAVDRVFRAKNAADAMAHARALYPKAKFPKTITSLPVKVKGIKLDGVTQGFLGALLPRDKTLEDYVTSSLRRASQECVAFQRDAKRYLNQLYQDPEWTDHRVGQAFFRERWAFQEGFEGHTPRMLSLQVHASYWGSIEATVEDDGGVTLL